MHKNILVFTTLLTNLCHFAKLFKISSDEIEEGQLVKVLCPLICHFHYLKNKINNLLGVMNIMAIIKSTITYLVVSLCQSSRT